MLEQIKKLCEGCTPWERETALGIIEDDLAVNHDYSRESIRRVMLEDDTDADEQMLRTLEWVAPVAFSMAHKLYTAREEKISERGQKALDYFLAGYNCAQAVLCAFEDELDMDEVQLFRLAEGLGGGMGGMKGNCGAVTAAYMVVSYFSSAGEPDDPKKTKKQTYERIKQVCQRFCGENFSPVCGLIKGDESLPKPLVTCQGYVRCAAELAARMIAENE